MKEHAPIFSVMDFKTRFKSRTNDQPVPGGLIAYAAKIVGEHPDVKIHVGTDSQNESSRRGKNRNRKVTIYATAVVFRYGTRGAHIVYIKDKVPAIKDNWTRLWQEIERTREVVHYITTNSSLNIYQVDLDFNEDETEFSNKLLASGKGLFLGMGFNVGTKPELLVATRAADHIVRH